MHYNDWFLNQSLRLIAEMASNAMTSKVKRHRENAAKHIAHETSLVFGVR